MILNSVEEISDELRTLSLGLTNALREPVGINCYASFGQDHSFDKHWDEHDVFAIQLAGEKHWTLFDNPDVPFATGFRSPTETCPDNVIGDFDLCEGDVLYVPRGCWHEVRGNNRPSLHVSVGVVRLRAFDLLRSLLDNLEEDEVWGASLPRHTTPDRLQAFQALLQKALAAMGQREISVDEFLQRSEEELRSPLVTNLPWAVADGEPIDESTLVAWRAPVPREAEKHNLGPGAERVVHLLQEKPRTIAELTLLTPDANIADIIRSFAKEGLVELTGV